MDALVCLFDCLQFYVTKQCGQAFSTFGYLLDIYLDIYLADLLVPKFNPVKFFLNYLFLLH